MNYLTDNTRIVEKFDLITPNEVLEKYPLTDEVAALISVSYTHLTLPTKCSV